MEPHVMMPFVGIKTQISAMNYQSKAYRKGEKSALKNARQLSGRYPVKHDADQPHPEKSKKVLIAEKLPDAAAKAQQKYDEFWGLQRFRKNVLRKELRHTYLALAFMNDRRYQEVEDFAYSEPNWDHVEKLVFEYAVGDPRDIKQHFAEWLENAKKFVKSRKKEEILPMSQAIH